jgi:UDP-N-acetylmuramate--alanine ligase
MYLRSGRIHFIGIGGAGMSGIAEVLLNMGYSVSGSDVKASDVTERLVRLGGRVFIGHSGSNVEGAQVVVYSTAIQPGNPELAAARLRGLPVIARAEMLAELMRMKYGVAVGGSHGKTTTTSMIAAVLARGGLDPTIVVGGRLRALGSNARLGHGQFLVAEADESDGSFLRLAPAVAVVTNIDREHLDHYADLAEIARAFVYFANRVPFYGLSILCGDDPNVRRILPELTKRHVLYGIEGEVDVRATDVRLESGGSRAKVSVFGHEWGEFRLQVPGRHNVLNAMAAIAAGLELEVGRGHIVEALAEFAGVARRFELRGTAAGVQVIDDYGHHPTEIVATLAAARGQASRVLVIFQPHRYTRTAALLREFGACFAAAERVWVIDIYAAGEAPLPGVTAASVAESARTQGFEHVEHVADGHDAARAAAEAARAGDLVITLGAGDVYKLGDEVLQHLEAQARVAGGR